jgi:hypothetical protein
LKCETFGIALKLNNMKILLITLVMIWSGRLYAQFDNFYFGVDFGLIREVNQVVSNDNDYFSCWRNCWSDKDNFFQETEVLPCQRVLT